LPLTEDEMVRVLTEPDDALIRQFKALFSLDNIDIQFDIDSLKEIGREANSRPTGARALRSILERVTKEYAYECPSDPTVKAIHITKEVVEGKAKAEIQLQEPAVSQNSEVRVATA
jgi:ATP-dependent Clp protease ATP-binding subunit ClpX